MVLPRIDCNKSIVISLSNIIIYANTSSMGSFDDRENQPKGEFHREKKHDPNESIRDILLSKERPYVFLLPLRRQMLA